MRKFALVLTVLLSLSAGQALADSVVFTFDTGSGATNHSYQFISALDVSLSYAEAAATVHQLLDGTTGYLATSISQQEEAFLVQSFAGTFLVGSGSVVNGHAHVWLGAADISPFSGAADWRWVTGSVPGENGDAASQFWSGGAPIVGGHAVGGSYTNWALGQPSGPAIESGLEWNNALNGTVVHSTWNDVSTDGIGISGYFVEFDSLNPIPEPTTALLLTFGLAGLGLRRRH